MFLPTYYYIFMLCVLLQIFQESNTGKKWMWDWDQKTVNHPLLTLVSVSNALFMILDDQHSIRPTKIQGQSKKLFSLLILFVLQMSKSVVEKNPANNWNRGQAKVIAVCGFWPSISNTSSIFRNETPCELWFWTIFKDFSFSGLKATQRNVCLQECFLCV